MIRIIRTRTLTALREEAARVPKLQHEAEQLREHAASLIAETLRAIEGAQSARVEAARMKAEFEAFCDSKLAKLADLRVAAQSDDTREHMRGAIALRIIQLEIERVEAKGTEQEKRDIRPAKALLGAQMDLAQPADAAAMPVQRDVSQEAEAGA